jgi:hypothetical protein
MHEVGVMRQIQKFASGDRMARLSRVLLTIEVIVCFAPLLLMLVVGALLIPMQVLGISDEPLIWQGPATLIGSVVCGVIGLFTLIFVLANLFLGRSSIDKPALICTGVALGALPIVPIAVFGDSLPWRLFGVLPLAATAHILFLGRRMIFPSWRDGLRSVAIATTVAPLSLLPLVFNPFGTTRDTLRDRKALWEEAAPSRYEFTVQLSGWLEPEALHPKRVVVENGDVVSASYEWNFSDHSAGDPAPVENLWTMDRAFAELLAAKERGWSVSTRFDERWGFAERAFVDTDEPTSGWDLEIRDFRVIRE